MGNDSKKNTTGFTLIELLIAVSIIAVLVSLGLVSYLDIQKKGRDARRQSDLKVIQSALEQYRADQSNYPVAGNMGIGTSLTSPDNSRTYLQQVPAEPAANPQYVYEPLPSSCDNSSEACIKYCLYAAMDLPANANLGAVAGCGAPSSYPDGTNIYAAISP